MLLPHMFFELVRATIAISFIVTTGRNLAMMAHSVVNVENVTIEVGCASEGLEATVITARCSLWW